LQPALEDSQAWLGELAAEVEVLYNDSHSPLAWIVHDLHVTPPIRSEDRLRGRPWMQAILFPFEQWIDLRRAAWVEDDLLALQAPQGRLQFTPDDDGEESCRIARYEPQTIEIEAVLNATGLVVLAEAYYPGWSLEIETDGQIRSAPILRSNRIMRGALLPAGKHKLVYRYQPMSFYVGMAISVTAVALALLLAVANRLKMAIRATA
jgi:hypothetical protein